MCTILQLYIFFLKKFEAKEEKTLNFEFSMKSGVHGGHTRDSKYLYIARYIRYTPASSSVLRLRAVYCLNPL